MFFDAYTKLVLTVIAVSLTVISFRMSIPSASALGSCGWDVLHACHVTVENFPGSALNDECLKVCH